MPTFIYTAKSQPHKIIQGNIEAESEQDAINKLTQKGYFPVSVKPEELQPAKAGFALFRKKIPKKDIVLFIRQLSSLVESGVNILNSLNIISGQIPNKSLKPVINDIGARIKNGKSLSESMSTYPNIFPSLYTSIILSGEIGGSLEQTLNRLADFLEKEEELKNSIRASMLYPSFIFAVGVLTVATLLGFVIPRLVSMFEDMGQVLPLPTRLLIGISNSLRHYAWLILSLSCICIFLFQRLYHKPQGRLALDKLKLNLPLFADIALKAEVGRISRTLALLLSGGIPMIQALNISGMTIENSILKLEVQKFKEQIAQGASLSRCLKESKLFPSYVTNIITIAEETGTLEKSFIRVADTYEREVERSLKTLAQLLEPLMILTMGLVVGFIVLSMLLPIFQINLIVR